MELCVCVCVCAHARVYACMPYIYIYIYPSCGVGKYTVLPHCYAPPFCDLLSGKRGGGITTRTCAFASQLSPPLRRIRVLCSAVEDENSFDRHAVAVLEDGLRVVGHVHVAKHSR